jgi:hypothetical protein
MKESLATLTAVFVMMGLAMWITPAWLAAIEEWILFAAVILWFLPNIMFA